MDNLFKIFQQYLPTPMAWVLSLLCWPLANLAKALPQLLQTVLRNKIDIRKLRIQEERWEIEKRKLLSKAETLAEQDANEE